MSWSENGRGSLGSLTHTYAQYEEGVKFHRKTRRKREGEGSACSPGLLIGLMMSYPSMLKCPYRRRRGSGWLSA